MATLIDSIPFLNTLRDSVFLTATVSDITNLTPTMRRIRFRDDRLKQLAWKPGQHVRLQVGGLLESALRWHPHDALRTYSIHDANPDLGTLDIVMLDHSGDPGRPTPARRWSSGTAIGHRIQMTHPQGNFVLRDGAPYHLFAGEETASVAFAAMLRSLPDDADVYGVVEAATAADHLELDRPMNRVERGDASAEKSELLAQALRELALPDHPGAAYLAGEARTVQTLRRILVDERGWDRRNVRTKPFWTPGRRGME